MAKTLDDLMKLSASAKPETITRTLQDLFPTVHAANLLDTERDVLFKALSKTAKVRESSLRSDYLKYLATRETTAKEVAAQAPVPPGVEAEAEAILKDSKLLERAIDTIGRLGVVGERANRGILYLAHTSRLLGTLISVFIKGRSAGGKSNLVKQVLKLIPPEAYYEFTAMSAKALAYADMDLKHKHLIIYEEAGNEESEYLVRTLLSEDQIRYLTTEKNAKGGMGGREIIREGPTGLITTLTRARVKEDNETRAWSLYVDDSTDQTLRVIGALASRAAGGGSSLDVYPWQVAQRKLERLDVLIPYAPALAGLLNTEALPADSTRLRRDFGRLLTLVQVITLLYQYQRDKDAEGRLIATFDDYRLAYDLVAKPFAESASELSPQALKLARALRELYDNQSEAQPLTPKQLQAHLRWSKMTVHKWLPQVEAAGLAEVEAGKGNQPSRITPSGLAPEEHLALLPTPEALFTAVSSADAYTQGEKVAASSSQTQEPVSSQRKAASTAYREDAPSSAYTVDADLYGVDEENSVRDAKEDESGACVNGTSAQAGQEDAVRI